METNAKSYNMVFIKVIHLKLWDVNFNVHFIFSLYIY